VTCLSISISIEIIEILSNNPLINYETTFYYLCQPSGKQLVCEKQQSTAPFYAIANA